ncbi:MAG: hypothetical protein H7Z76_04620 [Methylotenera sp.]|nr:hypothetical protein [Flavobacterium sp.]
MNEEKLIYDVVVGYMLKVIKSKALTIKYKNEFNAIKHGNYVCFINLIGIGISNDITVYREGEIIQTERQMEMKNADFLFLLLSGQSLLNFHSKCHKEFGNIVDPDLSSEDFENLAHFEMILRMFANDKFLIERRTDLFNVINSLCKNLSIPKKEIEIIQNGREFLNMVKGHKAKFLSYEEGLIAFSTSLEVLKKNNMYFYF